MNLVILDGHTLNPGDNPWDPLARFGQLTIYPRTPPDQIIPRAAHAHIAVTNKVPFSADTLAQLPLLKLIAVTATGYNIVDAPAARARGITVCNVPTYGTDSVAQHVFALILELSLHVAQHDQAVHAGEWSRSPDFCFWQTPLIELAGKTLGVIGFGRIGRRVAEIGHAFRMRILAHDANPANPPAYPGFAFLALPDLLRASDFISLHTPLTPQTTGLINRSTLALLKPTAFLINTARGPLIQDEDLADALNSDRLAGAALDVLSAEPPPPDHPLLAAKNCLLTPHLAWATLEARQRLMHTTAGNIAAFLAAQPINVINP